MALRSLLSSLPTPSSPVEQHLRRARVAVATVAAVVAAVLMRWWDTRGDLPAALWIPALMLALSAALLHHGAVGSQLLARSAWWSTLVLGTVIAGPGGTRSEARVGMLLALASGTALLAMGRLGLDETAEDRSAFRPIAFRTTLSLGMIMAVADAQALALFGALKLQMGGWKGSPADDVPQGILLLLSAAALTLAIAGLYRLRVWGLLLAMVASAGIVVLNLVGAYGLPGPLGIGLISTSAVQVLLPLPIVAAILRRRAVEPSGAPSPLARWAPPVLVGLMMAGASAGALLLRPWSF